MGSQKDPSDGDSIERSISPSTGHKSSNRTGNALQRLKSGLSNKSGASIDPKGFLLPGGLNKKPITKSPSQRSASAKVSYEKLPETDQKAGGHLSVEDMEPENLLPKKVRDANSGKRPSVTRVKGRI